MKHHALPTAGRRRVRRHDPAGRPWTKLVLDRGVHQIGTGSLYDRHHHSVYR